MKAEARTSILPAVVLTCLLAAVGTAKELDFSASVDRTLVGLGERFVLTVTVSGTNIGRVPRPTLPELDGLNDLGSTSSQSTNISFVNGRMTQQQTISYIYHLSPNRLGDITIGPTTIEFQGETYQTQPITIIAVKEPQQQAPPPRPQPQRRPDPFDPFDMWDPFGQRQQQRQPQTGGTVQDNVHVTAYADRTTVYQGEQVTVSYSFYTRLQIGDLQVAGAPSFSGFWVETLFDARQLEFRTREYDGQQYNAAAIKRVALFPTRSGELTVGSMKMAGQVVRPGGFFFQST
ncbi:MAG: BatD family protein, partial [candidate division WOR-3 bacterium]